MRSVASACLLMSAVMGGVVPMGAYGEEVHTGVELAQQADEYLRTIVSVDQPIDVVRAFRVAGFTSYTRGVLEAWTVNKAVCLPPKVSYGQVYRTVALWLQARPQHLHKSTHLLVFSALTEAFPCQLPKSQ